MRRVSWSLVCNSLLRYRLALLVYHFYFGSSAHSPSLISSTVSLSRVPPKLSLPPVPVLVRPGHETSRHFPGGFETFTLVG